MPRHGGGGFGGGRGGGFGGGRPGGGFGGRPPGGGPRPPSPPRRPMFFFGPRRRFFGPRYYGGGCFTFVIVFILILVLSIFIGIFSFCEYHADDKVDDGIPQSTVERTPMDASLLTPIDAYYESKSSRFSITDDLSVTDAMRYFFEESGVQPYLYVIDEIDGNSHPTTSQIMNAGFDRYTELFGSDEGHLLVTLFYYTDYEYDFYVDLIVGDNAASVMDTEACQILRETLIDRLEQSEWGNLTVDEAVSQAFRGAADNIMGGASGNSIRTSTVVLIIVVVALIIALIVFFVRRKKGGDDHTENRAYNDGI